MRNAADEISMAKNHITILDTYQRCVSHECRPIDPKEAAMKSLQIHRSHPVQNYVYDGHDVLGEYLLISHFDHQIVERESEWSNPLQRGCLLNHWTSFRLTKTHP